MFVLFLLALRKAFHTDLRSPTLGSCFATEVPCPSRKERQRLAVRTGEDRSLHRSAAFLVSTTAVRATATESNR